MFHRRARWHFEDQSGGPSFRPFMCVRVWERPLYHNVWRENGDAYVMSESGRSGKTCLYRLAADGVPTYFSTVSEGSAIADATLFRDGTRYWIAYTDTTIGLHNNLCLMYADDLCCPWTPHRGNPVKLDITSSRLGGTPFLLREH
jgi:hypothetical protein